MDQSTSGNPGSAQTARRLVLLAIIIGVLARFAFLGSKPLWEDEAWTFNVATSTEDLLTCTGLDPHPLSYYQFCRWLPPFFKTSEAMFRVPSAVFSSLALIFWALFLAQAGLDRKTQVWCVFLFAVLPVNLRFAAEARVYALLQMCSVFVLFAGFAVLKRPTGPRCLVFFIAAALCCHLDGLGFAVPFLLGAYVLSRVHREPGGVRALLCLVAGAISSIPYYWIRLKYMASAGEAHAIPEPGNLGNALVSRVVQMSPFGIGLEHVPERFEQTVMALAFVTVVVLIASAIKRKPIQRLFALIGLVPPALFFGLSIVFNMNLLHPKYLLVAVPGLVPMFVIGFTWWVRSRPGPALVVLFLVPLTVGVVGLMRLGGRADWRSLHGQMAGRLRPNDGFVQESYENYPLYAFGPLRAYARFDGHPIDAASLQDYDRLEDGVADIPFDVASFLNHSARRRVWTITTEWMSQNRELDLSPFGAPLMTCEARGVRATLWDLNAPATPTKLTGR